MISIKPLVIVALLTSVSSCNAEDVSPTLTSDTNTVQSERFKDDVISSQQKQIDDLKAIQRQQAEFQERQLKEMQLQRQELAHQTEQQRRDAQKTRWRLHGGGLNVRSLLFDPLIPVWTKSTLTP